MTDRPTVPAFAATLDSSRSLPVPASLTGRDGELVLLTITVPPRLLEALLEALAESEYHINPQVLGCADGNWAIEFPAYEGWIAPLKARLRRAGLDRAAVVETRTMLAAIGE